MKEIKKVKQSDCRLQGEITLSKDSQTDTQSQKITLLARTSIPFYHHGFEAETINDFASMTHNTKIVLDWEHDQIIGYANQFEVTPEGLVLHGVLTGNTQASQEVISNLRNEIPLQASISYRDFDIDYIMPGESVTVNNQEYVASDDGLAVIRNWNLFACAVCKQGYDGNTKTDIELSYTINKGDKQMDTQSEVVDADVKDEVVETQAVESETVEAETKDEPVTEVVADTPTVEVTEQAEQATEELKLSVNDVKNYQMEFGNELALEYIAQGLSIQDAKNKHYELLKKENAELKAKTSVTQTAPAPAPVMPVQANNQHMTAAQIIQAGIKRS